MHRMVYIGVDNGVTATIGIIIKGEGYERTLFIKVPTFSEQSYTKKKGNITRIDVKALRKILRPYKYERYTVHIMLERPMVNPTRFKATTSALRALEATLNVIELLGFHYQYIDSKEWQKPLLPQGCKDTKKASRQIGIRMFPQHKELIEKHGDADGLLMAEHCRRVYR